MNDPWLNKEIETDIFYQQITNNYRKVELVIGKLFIIWILLASYAAWYIRNKLYVLWNN